jgi:hypothetical protein
MSFFYAFELFARKVGLAKNPNNIILAYKIGES